MIRPSPGRESRRGRHRVGRPQPGARGRGHAGEGETSILLDQCPEVVRDSYRDADHRADQRPHLLTLGMRGYSDTGVIGVPSAATAEKGARLLDAFSEQFKDYLEILR